MKQFILKKEGKVLIPICWVARDFFSRFLGLMGRKTLSDNEAIFFPHCQSIHTFFMRFAIDVVSLSKEGEVISVRKNLKPWRMTKPEKGVCHTLELRGGRSEELGILTGIKLEGADLWG